VWPPADVVGMSFVSRSDQINVTVPSRSHEACRLLSVIYVQGAYKLPEDFAKPYFHKY